MKKLIIGLSLLASMSAIANNAGLSAQTDKNQKSLEIESVKFKDANSWLTASDNCAVNVYEASLPGNERQIGDVVINWLYNKGMLEVSPDKKSFESLFLKNNEQCKSGDCNFELDIVSFFMNSSNQVHHSDPSIVISGKLENHRLNVDRLVVDLDYDIHFPGSSWEFGPLGGTSSSKTRRITQRFDCSL